ncbi:MAG: pyridoxamine 5'-phosphate oxidase family protein [Labilithrix sp.]
MATNHAEPCRALVAAASVATLSTLARDPEGFPYGSLVAFASDARGRPLLLLSRLAEHTENLRARPEASLLVCEAPGLAPDLALGRVTLLGRCTLVPDAEKSDVRTIFLARQPSAATYVDFADFAFYRLEPQALRYVGGFGRMSWVDVKDYLR